MYLGSKVRLCIKTQGFYELSNLEDISSEKKNLFFCTFCNEIFFLLHLLVLSILIF